MTSATKNPRLDYDALADDYASLAHDLDGGVEDARQGDSPLRPRRQSDTATVTSSTLCPGALDMSRSASTLLSDPGGTKDTSQPGPGSTSEMQADWQGVRDASRLRPVTTDTGNSHLDGSDQSANPQDDRLVTAQPAPGQAESEAAGSGCTGLALSVAVKALESRRDEGSDQGSAFSTGGRSSGDSPA